MQLVDTSELSFIQFAALDDVIDRYPHVCREIEERAFVFFKATILKLAIAAGLSPDDIAVSRLSVEYDGILRFYAFRSGRARGEPIAQPVRRRVGGFGPIRGIEVHCSASMRHLAEAGADAVVRSVESMHSLFAQRYVEINAKRQEQIVQDVFYILRAGCSQEEVRILTQWCRLSVTSPGDATFKFYFAREQLQAMIGRIAASKNKLGVDPVDALTAYLHGGDVDYFYQMFRAGETGFQRAPFADVGLSSINAVLHRVERLLAFDDVLSCIELQLEHGFSLQISTSTKWEATVLAIIERQRAALNSQFAANLQRHREGRNATIGNLLLRMSMGLSRLHSRAIGNASRATFNYGASELSKAGWEKLLAAWHITLS
jgi:hypothetical protein